MTALLEQSEQSEVAESDESSESVKPRLRGWIHFGAFCVTLTLSGFLISSSTSPGEAWAMAIYALGLAIMFGTSALLHLVTWGPKGRRRMRRADHSTIFLGIAGSYTAIGAVGLSGTNLSILLLLAWGGAVVGITIRQLFIDAPKWANAIPYVVVGWSAMFFVGPLISSLGVVGFLGILAGGLAYTAGALFYAAKRPNFVPGVFGYHELFHALTVVGAGLHMAVVWTALH